MAGGSRTSRVTITQIAREAGVSTSTVSKVLNGHGDVAQDTRTLVESVMRRNGYHRRPSRQRGALVDVVLNELDSDWSLEIVRGADEVLHAAGMDMVLSVVHGRSEETRQWLDRLAARRSAGVMLVVSELSDRQRERLGAMGVPLVLVDPVGGTTGDIPTVGATNWSGGMAGTNHLIELGHRRIAHIGGPAELNCAQARADGFGTAMQRAGLPVPPDHLSHGEFNERSGYAQAQALLALPEPPTAVFAASDLQALGAFEAMRERGLRAPDDLSVVGFDDLPLARRVSPPLTTVRQPILEMSTLATRTLLRLMDGEPLENPRVELATRLIVRESTRPLG
ncbi:LacI family DNA-binding transcriptional regulator [Streptomyces sp. NBRC 109706]|uniref:LacI family DNA-binding transcriptional regulator n=1 Tax=Streptomyces sp. NBRC 109706 TaxID=1550035 RepID=UPI000780C197|nr:LacI family DNA-binding transcriptional regulator [Streptomyces sp. NBRC 109706]